MQQGPLIQAARKKDSEDCQGKLVPCYVFWGASGIPISSAKRGLNWDKEPGYIDASIRLARSFLQNVVSSIAKADSSRVFSIVFLSDDADGFTITFFIRLLIQHNLLQRNINILQTYHPDKLPPVAVPQIVKAETPNIKIMQIPLDFNKRSLDVRVDVVCAFKLLCLCHPQIGKTCGGISSNVQAVNSFIQNFIVSLLKPGGVALATGNRLPFADPKLIYAIPPKDNVKSKLLFEPKGEEPAEAEAFALRIRMLSANCE